MTKLTKLFFPGSVGKLELKNRLVMAPMGTMSHDKEGFILPRTVDFYTERARGGVALIICQSSSILFESRAPGRPGAWDEKFIPGLRKISEAIHKYGAKAAFQVLHHGKLLTAHRKGMEHPDEIDPVAPSAIPWGLKKEVPREASKEDIKHLVDGFAEAARRIHDAGFDAVEVNGAHGYGIGQFLSPRTNHRTDEYGGNAENRARFACEIITAIKRRVGNDFPIIFRMSASEFIKGGITLEDSLIQAPLFEKVGSDALEVSGGVVETAHITNPCYLHYDAPFADLAAAIKGVVSIPVMVVGKIGNPMLAEQILKEGKADFVVMGRPLLADPELPKKAMAGEFEQIRRCLFCNNCWSVMERQDFKGRGIRCTVNPAILREKEFEIKPTNLPKKVLIAGGGLAGMEAAHILAQRGHKTILWEKNERLGGQWNIACKIKGKEDYARLTEQMAQSLEEAGVEVLLGREVTVEFIREVQPQVIVAATGAVPRIPNVPGGQGKNVVQAVDMISGNARVGEKVVVIGGRALGMETALMLAEERRHVSLCTRRELGRGVERYTAVTLRDRLVEKGVYLYPLSPLEEIHEDGVYVMNGRDLLFLPADTVVLAVGFSPKRELFEKLRVIFPELEIHAIGDCVEPRDAMEAIREGAEVGRTI
ncbi:MAG: NADH:flavin oxidoreductase [Deltaproteobacteria bacterium CG_4_8_14_3_um_filter_45_9]|nr:MAG: NADH:flavin oxidoreductase [Deltaproteobacteria bacterium CG_4_8_14_3_um_filter_45_9]